MISIPENCLKVIHIDPPKSGSGGTYVRIKFKDNDGNFYKTDVVQKFGNMEKWAEIIESGPGTLITNFVLWNENTVNADSKVEIYQDKKPEQMRILTN